MSRESTDGGRVLVVVEPRKSPARTVEHAVRNARDWHEETETPVTVDVAVVSAADAAAETVADAEARVDRALADLDTPAGVTTTVARHDADPGTAAGTDAVLELARDRDAAHVVFAGDTAFPVPALRDGLGVPTVDLAPTSTPERRRRLVHPGGPRRFAALFGLTYVFYLAVGGFAGGLDYLTGALSAGVVAAALSRVTLREAPAFPRTAVRAARFLGFLPVLLWEILKANVVVAAVILHPRLPIQPSMETYEPDAREGLERMVLANSITLTPGTLTVDVTDDAFTVHSLTAGALADLDAGPLPRLVAWVFHGRERAPEEGQE